MMTPGQILAAIVLAMVISAAGTWQVQDWRMGERLAEQAGLHKDDLAAISSAAAARARADQVERLALEQKLSGQDQQHSKELSDAQRNQALLRDRLATADVRLSVLIEDPASGCNLPAACWINPFWIGAGSADVAPVGNSVDATGVADRFVGVSDKRSEAPLTANNADAPGE